MDYFLNGNRVKFNANDFIAKGGQGSVYVKGSTVFKIYTDPSEMITPDKIKELKVIDHSNVLAPENIIMNSSQRPVGFTMPFIDNATPLVRLFNTGHRESVNFDERDTLTLIEQMQNTIQAIHDANVLQVDGNELNYLVASDNQPYFIDVDSYQTRNHKATVIMPSIRDYFANEFSTLTDWYSFAVIACQLFVGIHPYKGRHQGSRDIKKRALAKISIFNKAVTVPKSVRDFSYIPTEYMEWFHQLFENGERIPPPLVAGTLKLKPKVTVCAGSNLIKIKEIDPVLHFKNIVQITGDLLHVLNEKGKITSTHKKEEYTFAHGALYIKNHNKIDEVSSITFNGVTIPKVQSFSIAPRSSKVMDGLIYQNLLGRPFLTIPITLGNMVNEQINELSDYTIVDGKYENKVAMIIGVNRATGHYDRIVINFNNAHTKYTVEVTEDVNYYINFTVLDSGVVLDITEDGMLTLSSNSWINYASKEIKDDVISTEWKLTHEGNQAMFKLNNKLFEMRLN